ncbi:MAG TPA: hypothetical protein PKE62_07340 [Anaerolineales bacterium]|nr:hypothetical protein [Anaerolineales bacterium]
MGLKVFILFIAAVALISCETRELTVPPTPTKISALSPSSIPMKTLAPKKAPTFAPTIASITTKVTAEITFTPTLVFSPYTTKQAFLQYGNEGGFGDFNDILGRTSDERLVLYSDGHLIISKEDQFFEKTLTQSEMEQLLFQINKRGLYTLETNQNHDQTDKLYDFGNQYQRVYDGPIYYLSVSGDQPRTICYYGPYKDFLIPEAKDLFQ